jgi:uncharacterized protein YukE
MASAVDTQQEMTVENLRSLSRTYKDNAAKCERIGDFLKRQADSAYWQSEAASTFRTSMKKYQSTLKAIHDDFTTLSTEVSRRADVLADSQRG